MDESWRVPIGSVVSRRRSTEQTRRSGGSLGADDFRDVFGGPPRSVVLRQLSGGDPTSPCSSLPYFLDTQLHRDCKDWFRRPSGDPVLHSAKGAGRKLPVLDVPSTGARTGRGGRWVVRTEEGFYKDIFESGGGEGDRIRSRTGSRQPTSMPKSNSSSVLSSEDGGDSVGRLRAPLVDDAVLSSFASKLRPINVPSLRRGRSPTAAIVSMGEQSGSWRASTAPCPHPCFRESRLEDMVISRVKVDGDPSKRHYRPYFSPPDTAVGLGQDKLVTADDDSGSGSPSSALSSIYDDIPMATIVPVGVHKRLAALQELEKDVTVVMGDLEVESYGTIETVPGGNAVDAQGVGAVDEAIAWAKEKFRAAASSPEEIRVGDDELKRCSKMAEEHEDFKSEDP